MDPPHNPLRGDSVTKRTRHVQLKPANTSPLATAGRGHRWHAPGGHTGHNLSWPPQSMIWSFDLGLSSCISPAALQCSNPSSVQQFRAATTRCRSLARAQLQHPDSTCERPVRMCWKVCNRACGGGWLYGAQRAGIDTIRSRCSTSDTIVSQPLPLWTRLATAERHVIVSPTPCPCPRRRRLL